MTPAETIAWLLTEQGETGPLDVGDNDIGTVPAGTKNDQWPVYFSFMPDGENAPDNAICVYDTPGTTQGRYMREGKTVTMPGIQIKARASAYVDAYAKINQIAVFLDAVKRVTVSKNGVVATIAAITRKTPVSLGKQPGNRPRDAFTLNAMVSFF